MSLLFPGQRADGVSAHSPLPIGACTCPGALLQFFLRASCASTALQTTPCYREWEEG